MPAPRNVSAAERAAALRQRPLTVWLTGLSGAGKSTIATALERSLVDAKRACYLLDGDAMRTGLSRDLHFSPHDRHENIRRAAEVARLMNEAGLVVITAFISPYRADRYMACDVIGADRFLEVHIDAPLEVCEKRDTKGLYRRARAGEIADFTGISAPYEPPVDPAVRLDTARRSVDECVQQLLAVVVPRIS